MEYNINVGPDGSMSQLMDHDDDNIKVIGGKVFMKCYIELPPPEVLKVTNPKTLELVESGFTLSKRRIQKIAKPVQNTRPIKNVKDFKEFLRRLGQRRIERENAAVIDKGRKERKPGALSFKLVNKSELADLKAAMARSELASKMAYLEASMTCIKIDSTHENIKN